MEKETERQLFIYLRDLALLASVYKPKEKVKKGKILVENIETFIAENYDKKPTVNKKT